MAAAPNRRLGNGIHRQEATMAIVQTAGAKLFIAAPGAVVASPDPWTEVGEIASLGEFGRVYNEVTSEAINDRKVRKFKGTYNDGTLAITLNRNPKDAGQNDLIAALDDTVSDYNFKIEFDDDDPDASGTNPTRIRFKAKVMSYTTNLQGPNNMIQATCSLSIQSGSIDETPAL